MKVGAFFIMLLLPINQVVNLFSFYNWDLLFRIIEWSFLNFLARYAQNAKNGGI